MVFEIISFFFLLRIICRFNKKNFFFSQNKLFKILHRRNSQNEGQLLAIYALDGTTIHSMVLLKNEYLYIGEEKRVSQYRLGQCSMHSACETCANDPYCSWNIARAECFAREMIHATAVGWITDFTTSETDSTTVSVKCGNYLKSITKTLYPGDSVHLECDGATSMETQNYEWRMDRKMIKKMPIQHLIHTIDGGIVLMNVNFFLYVMSEIR